MFFLDSEPSWISTLSCSRDIPESESWIVTDFLPVCSASATGGFLDICYKQANANRPIWLSSPAFLTASLILRSLWYYLQHGSYLITRLFLACLIGEFCLTSGSVRVDCANSKTSWIFRRNNVEPVSLLQQEFSELLRATIDLSWAWSILAANLEEGICYLLVLRTRVLHRDGGRVRS